MRDDIELKSFFYRAFDLRKLLTNNNEDFTYISELEIDILHETESVEKYAEEFLNILENVKNVKMYREIWLNSLESRHDEKSQTFRRWLLGIKCRCNFSHIVSLIEKSIIIY